MNLLERAQNAGIITFYVHTGDGEKPRGEKSAHVSPFLFPATLTPGYPPWLSSGRDGGCECACDGLHLLKANLVLLLLSAETATTKKPCRHHFSVDGNYHWILRGSRLLSGFFHSKKAVLKLARINTCSWLGFALPTTLYQPAHYPRTQSIS